MSLPIASLIVLASSLGLPDDKPAIPTGDLAKLQGEWTATVGPNKDIPIAVEFKAAKVAIKGEFNGNAFEVNGEVKLDEKASPKTLDWTKFTSPQGDDVPDNLGIYKFEGESLVVCSGGPGNDRPKEFKAGDDGPPNLVVFKKKAKAETPVKPAEKGAGLAPASARR